MSENPNVMSVKDTIREVRKTVNQIAKQISDTRRELQLLAHELKVTPIRNILMDEIRIRRPVQRLRRAFWGEE